MSARDEAPVLPFPQTKLALQRRRTGMGAAGLIALMLLDREGGTTPANVQRIDEPEGVTPLTRSPELLLALCVFGALTPKQRDKAMQTIRAMAFGDPFDPSAVQLYSLLRGRF